MATPQEASVEAAPKSPTLAKTPTPTTLRAAKKGHARSEEPVDAAILEVLSRKGRAGRRPGAVWDFFTPVKTAQNRTHATCNFCARRCAGVAARMISHILDKCPSAPTEATEALVTALAQGPAHKRQRVDASQPETLPTAPTLTNDGGVANAAAVAVGLAAFRAHVANGNTRNGGGVLMLEEVDPARRKHGAMRPLPTDTLTLALHKLVVACLRRHAPLNLLEDEFFRDALVLLRPGSSFALKQATGEALIENVHATVVHDIAQWMRASETFTLIHHGVAQQTQWRGADDKRHAVLLVERAHDEPDMVSVAAFVESLLSLVGEQTVVGVCSDSPPVLEELAASGDVCGRVKLWSKCLLAQSLALWSLVVQNVPQVASVVVGSAEIARLYAPSPPPSKTLTTASPWSTTSSWSLPFTLIKRVLAMSQSLKLSETQPGDSEGMVSAARSEFWADLAAVDALLAPLPWLFVLGECEHACSSHFVLLWIWLLAEIEACTLLPSDRRECLTAAVASVLRSSLQDHHLVALLLDPRLCGAGLSATGRRKAKAFVVQVAVRLWPDVFNATDNAPLARQSLLSQLGHYLDKSAYFADDVAWEMVRGSPPESFWRDYAKDAPELAKLAMAVLTFVPVSRSMTSDERGRVASHEPFAVRQTRFHFERNRKNGETDVANLLTKHCELLAPIVCVDATSAAPASTTTSSLQETPSTDRASSPSVADAVGVEIERVRSLGGDNHQTTDTTTTSEHGVAFELSWFAYETDADGVDIKAALRHLVPPPLLPRPPKPPSDYTAVLLV